MDQKWWVLMRVPGYVTHLTYGTRSEAEALCDEWNETDDLGHTEIHAYYDTEDEALDEMERLNF